MRALPAGRARPTTLPAVVDRAAFLLVNVIVYLRHPLNVALFRSRVGYLPNIALPARYNEIMLWRKIFDHNPSFIVFSDKLSTKDFVARRCPEAKVPQTLWSGDDAADMPTELLCEPVVVKANHGSDMIAFLNTAGGTASLATGTMKRWLSAAHGRRKLEWAYRHARRLIFVERFIAGADGAAAVDICVHTANGAALFVEAIVNNKSDRQRKGYFRTDGTRWAAIERRQGPHERTRALPPDYELPAPFTRADEQGDPATALSDGRLLEALEYRSRHYGAMINADFGEPYFSTSPLPFDTVSTLLQSGGPSHVYSSFF